MEDKQSIENFINEYSNSLRDVTLCYLMDKKSLKVLLAMKKRGFGVGKLNGVGGKLKPNETVEQAMVRETMEEIKVSPKRYSKVATVDFYFGGSKPNPEFNQRAHVFLCEEWVGVPSESEEMKPEWFSMNSIPLNLMWDDDRYWLPYILKGKNVKASFLFNDDGKVADMKISYKSLNAA